MSRSEIQLPADFGYLVETIRLEAEALQNAPGSVIIATPHAWSLVDNEIFSVRNMDDEELRQTVVEDLVALADWERQGKEIDFTAASLSRFLRPDLHDRVASALSDPFVQSLLERRTDGQLRIHKDHLQDAMDFCGVWLEGFEILTDGPVICAFR
ncbi:MAG: hypothetical protein DI537_10270 [Stutzerimonas stutzeri]|nr:MAG: hypothetical protein DI537_10270 [Stutzerimonas stutzeri]